MTDQANKPNPADFSLNEKPGEYEIVFRIEGEIRETVTASSIEEAKTIASRKADAMLDDAGIDLDEVTEARVDYVRKSQPMYRVMRDGRNMQVSHLQDGDMPRQPDERGF